jgi:membrane associated rhomboid family serine protease
MHRIRVAVNVHGRSLASSAPKDVLQQRLGYSTRRLPQHDVMQSQIIQPMLPPLPPPKIRYVRPLLFAAVASGCVFGVSIAEYDHRQRSMWKRIRQWTGNRDVSLSDAWMAQKKEIAARVNRTLAKLESLNVPEDVRRAYLIMYQKWESLKESEKTIAGIIAINTIVFAAWQIPVLRPFMRRHFVHDPLSGRSLTLLTSCFSHQELWHFGLNMMALWSFGGVVHDYLGREQFLAFYLTTGMAASAVSHVFGLGMRRVRPVLPSLGASGAIYGCLSATAVLHPDASVYVVFLPFLPIKIG